MSEAVVHFRDVVKRFRLRNRSQSLRDTIPNLVKRAFGKGAPANERFTALDGVSFSVSPGEVVGLVGPNGAGKSTSLRLAAGVFRPDAGEVEVQGRTAAMIELSAGFHPDLSGRENIYLNAALLGLRKWEVAEAFDRIVEFADIGEFLESPIRTYSSGMAVRLGFSVAAHVPADVLLVDEVLAVGDLDFQSRCLNRMAERRRDGVAVMFVSHNMGVVEQFCDRVILLEKGRIVGEGAPGPTIDEYRRRILGRPLTGDNMDARRQGRAGTGEVVLEKVEVGAGTSGGRLEVLLRYSAEKPVRGPIFGIAFHDERGAILSENRSGERGDPDVVIEGSGTASVVIERLPLLPGAYQLTAYVRDSTGIVNYDFQRAMHPLRVEGDRTTADSGSLLLDPKWSLR